jgi:LacI family transcriptional regulator
VTAKTALTQKELARRLGVSQTLVSRVLAGHGESIGAAVATIRRIRLAAAEGGYRPSPAAVALRGGPTRVFGVAVRDFRDPFFGHILGELQELARRHAYTLLLTGGARDDLAAMRGHAPDGLILVGSDFEPEGLGLFLGDRKPVVRIGCGAPRDGVLDVVMDEAAALDALLGHLLGLGHRRIGFLGTDSASSGRRAQVLKEILAARGTAAGITFCRLPMDAAEAGHAGLHRLLDRPRPARPTAVLAAEDTVALGVLRAAATRGLRVPRDLSVTGVDDIPSAGLAVPALTTIRQPVRQMIRAAFDVLSGKRLERAGGIRIRPGLIVRESSGPAHVRRAP